MLFLGETRMPEGVLPGPDKRSWWEFSGDYGSQFSELVASSHREQMLVDNSESEVNALMEAYDKRIADVAKATGVELQNPIRRPGYVLPDVRMRLLGVKRGGLAGNQALEEEFNAGLRKLAGERPDQAGVIRAEIPISDDAAQIAQDARRRAEAALKGSQDLGTVGRFSAQVFGAGSGMLRDPLGASLALVGGPSSSVAKSFAGRIVTRIGTEATVNAGSEAIMQLMAQEWRQKAGVEDPGFWQNVGLAAAFGGGLGGALEGGSAALRALGRETPETRAALARIAENGGTEADLKIIAEAAGVEVAPDELADLARAAEVDGDGAAVQAAADAAGTDLKAVDDATIALERGQSIQEPAIEIPPAEKSGIAPGINPAPKSETGAISKPLTEDADYLDFVRNLQEEKELALEAFVRENEKDLAFLKSGGFVGDLPSGRRFETIAARNDEEFAQKVEAEITRKLERDVKAIKARGNIRADDPAVQLRYQELMQPRQVVPPAAKDAALEPATPQALDAAKEAAEAEKARKMRGYVDTRGKGMRFHGSPSPLGAVDDYHYGSKNYYGNGFYTSDAMDVIDGYAKRKGAEAPSYYRVEEVGDVKAFDMEQPVPDWLVASELKNAEKSDLSSLVAMAMDENPKTVRALYDEIRLSSRGEGISADEVQELFATFKEIFVERGYNALDHIGGLLTKTVDHSVRIYFEPSKQIKITAIDPSEFKAIKPTEKIVEAAPAAAAAPAPAAPAAPGAPKTGTSLDAIDGLPAGIDGNGQPVVVRISDLKAEAAKSKGLADLVAACKVA